MLIIRDDSNWSKAALHKRKRHFKWKHFHSHLLIWTECCFFPPPLFLENHIFALLRFCGWAGRLTWTQHVLLITMHMSGLRYGMWIKAWERTWTASRFIISAAHHNQRWGFQTMTVSLPVVWQQTAPHATPTHCTSSSVCTTVQEKRLVCLWVI